MTHDCRSQAGWHIRLFLLPGRTRAEAYMADQVEFLFRPHLSVAHLKEQVDAYLKTLPTDQRAGFTVTVHHVASRATAPTGVWTNIYALTVSNGNRPIISLIEPLFPLDHADRRSKDLY